MFIGKLKVITKKKCKKMEIYYDLKIKQYETFSQHRLRHALFLFVLIKENNRCGTLIPEYNVRFA
jgi:hypothetical protein